MTIKTKYMPFLTSLNHHLYADGTDGDDRNSGLSTDSPKKTLKAIFKQIPTFSLIGPSQVHYYPKFYVHCRGTFETLEDNWIDHDLGSTGIYLDGGDETTEVVAPFTVTMDVNGLSVTKTGAVWTPDEFKGYMVKCTAGDPSDVGTYRTCVQNTEDTLYISYIWVGATEVTLVKPKTTLGTNTNTVPIGFNVFNYSGGLNLQRLTINEPKFYIVSTSMTRLTGVVIEKCAAVPIQIKGQGNLTLGSGYYDIDNVDIPYVYTPLWATGLGITTNAGNTEIDARGAYLYAYDSVLNDITILGGAGTIYGGRYRKVFTRGGDATVAVGYSLTRSGTKVLNSDDVGILVEFGNVLTSGSATGFPINISNATSHAIEARRHGVVLVGQATTGSNNGGGGLYVHGGSVAYVNRNTVDRTSSSVSGAKGELTDGLYPKRSWSDLERSVFFCTGDNFEMCGLDYY